MTNQIRQNNENITMKQRDMQRPKIMLTWIWKGHTKEELKAMIVEENEDIRNNYGRTLEANTRILARRSSGTQ